MPPKNEDELQDALEAMTAERDKYKAESEQLYRENTNLRIQKLEDQGKDHETRIRKLEPIATRSNVLYALTTGGGALAIIVLLRAILYP